MQMLVEEFKYFSDVDIGVLNDQPGMLQRNNMRIEQYSQVSDVTIEECYARVSDSYRAMVDRDNL